MNTTLDSDRTDTDLRNALALDFARASVALSKARVQQEAKDSPAHRAAVTAARDDVDAVLDMYLAVCHGLGRPTGAARGPTPSGQSRTMDP